MRGEVRINRPQEKTVNISLPSFPCFPSVQSINQSKKLILPNTRFPYLSVIHLSVIPFPSSARGPARHRLPSPHLLLHPPPQSPTRTDTVTSPMTPSARFLGQVAVSPIDFLSERCIRMTRSCITLSTRDPSATYRSNTPWSRGCVHDKNPLAPRSCFPSFGFPNGHVFMLQPRTPQLRSRRARRQVIQSLRDDSTGRLASSLTRVRNRLVPTFLQAMLPKMAALITGQAPATRLDIWSDKNSGGISR